MAILVCQAKKKFALPNTLVVQKMMALKPLNRNALLCTVQW